MASRSTNTLPELLQRFLADLGQFKMVASDSDLASAVELETSILQMARKPIDQINQQGLTSAPPPPGAGQPGMGQPGMGAPPMGGGQMPGMPGAPNMAAPGPTPGAGPRAPMPSPDELRRLLGGAQVSRESRILARNTQG